ncbi:MAG TPA: HD domain-containing phosphohydrolase [Solirubrobacteraceae bacterium]
MPSQRRRDAGVGQALSKEFERALELASLLESASDAVVGATPEGMIKSWGSGAERLFGYTSQEAVGQHISMLAPPDRAEEPGAFLRQALDGDRVEQLDTERIAKDGARMQVLLSLMAVRGPDGSIAGALGIYRDVSEQRSAERALKESERRYHPVIEALSEGVIMQDRRGRVVAFNSSVERILGLSAEEVAAGAPNGEWSLIREDGSPIAQLDYPTIVSLRTGDPQKDVVVGVETPDMATRWLSVNSTPLIDAEGERPHAVVASFTDITELRATLTELQEARSEDLQRLALVSEYRDDDTNRHTERVGRSCELMACALGYDEDFAWRIRRAAPLHDVGKIGIPDSILLKPAALTPEEFEVMKTHTAIGGRILCHSRSPVLRMATAIAFTDHERWDGTGYPAGMEELEIPLVGRIVAVADAFDAITHDRPYRGARSVAEALDELRRYAGSQFDPDVLAAFMALDHDALVESS